MKWSFVIASSCFIGAETPSDSRTPETSETPDVEVWIYDFDFDHGCWCGELELLDGDLWGAYAMPNETVCTWQIDWTSATVDGECITAFHDCGGVPEDPWLAPCETVQGCCELDILGYPLCQDDGVSCEEDTGSVSP